VELKVTLAANGDVQGVDVLRSSGHLILDQEAVRAVQRWKAHSGRRWSLCDIPGHVHNAPQPGPCSRFT
jgi:TonB family protein